jgi:formate hydrogenlyase subunit 3/multisubunit Na+/H+ antiporter MnhD subunit
MNAFTLPVLMTALITLGFYTTAFYQVFFRRNPDAAGKVAERDVLTVAPITALALILLVLGLGAFFGIVSLEKIETIGATLIKP